MAGIDNFGEVVRKAFLVGVGTVALGAEKSQGIIEDLVKKGELTIEQGKALNEELKRKVDQASSETSDALLRAKLRSMSPEERAAWLAHAQEVADDIEAQRVEVEVESEEVVEDASEGDGETPTNE